MHVSLCVHHLKVRRGYSTLLDSKQQRWAAAQLALTHAVEDVAHFHAALQTLPRARPTPHSGAWFSALLKQVIAHTQESLPLLQVYHLRTLLPSLGLFIPWAGLHIFFLPRYGGCIG